jgi:hypothetical protein
MINDFNFFHGAVFTRIIHSWDHAVPISLLHSGSNSSYVIDGKIGIYVKYSAKRMSPWRFSFAKEHQEEIEFLRSNCTQVFVVLVCNDDGIVCLSYAELKRLLDQEFGEMEWLSVSRRKREMYTVAGSNGALDFKIGANEFPSKLFSDATSPTTSVSAGSYPDSPRA